MATTAMGPANKVSFVSTRMNHFNQHLLDNSVLGHVVECVCYGNNAVCQYTALACSPQTLVFLTRGP